MRIVDGFNNPPTIVDKTKPAHPRRSMFWKGYKAILWAYFASVFAGTVIPVLAATVPGHVEGWGQNTFGQATPPAGLDGVIAIAAGSSHSIALRTNGTVVAWGANFSGAAVVPNGLSNVVAIDAGTHNVALKEDGTVVVWGEEGRIVVTNVPAGLAGVKAIAAGNTAGNPYTLALRSNGTVVAWGANDLATNVPPGLNGVVGIAAGNSHALALKADGTVVGWGENLGGKATPPPGLSSVVAVRAGQSSSLAIKSDGTVVMWGSFDPVPSGLGSVVDVQFGGNQAMALLSNGVAVAWGFNASGQGTVPIRGNGITAIAAGGNHNLVLTARPVITSISPPVLVNVGDTVTFSVGASGAPLTFQWRHSGTNLLNQTGSSLTLVNVQASDAGTFDVLVTNPFGTVESPVTSLSFPPPRILSQPQPVKLYRGQTTASFNVSADGLEPLTYQWFKAGTLLPDQTSPTLSLINVGSTNLGSYRVTVTDVIGGSVTSLVAMLTIIDPTDTNSLTFVPILDTGIYSAGIDAQGVFSLLAGTRNNGIRDRSLLRFDLSPVSSGAVIESARLHLTVTRVPLNPFPSTFHLHRMLVRWGQDATWANATAGAPWMEPGGQVGIDYSAVTSGTCVATSLGPCDFGSSEQMVADLQSWLANPQTNHGWMLKTADESLLRSARHFGSSESTQPPQLFLQLRGRVRLTNPGIHGGNFTFVFDAADGWFHRVQSADSPAGGTWATATNVPAGPVRTISISVPVTPARRFFRVLSE